MWQTDTVNWEQTTVMFKVSFQYGSCQTMSLCKGAYLHTYGGGRGEWESVFLLYTLPINLHFCFCHSQLSCPYDTMALTSTLHVESVHYTHVQEEFVYWLEYFKSRRKHMSLKKITAPELTKIDQQ